MRRLVPYLSILDHDKWCGEPETAGKLTELVITGFPMSLTQLVIIGLSMLLTEPMDMGISIYRTSTRRILGTPLYGYVIGDQPTHGHRGLAHDVVCDIAVSRSILTIITHAPP